MTNSNKKLIYDTFRETLNDMTPEEMVDFAFKDSASNCRNERYLTELFKLNQSKSGTTAIVMLDVVSFQSINYQYGSVFGQKVLRHLGNFLLNAFKPTDEVIRYYGDVFVAVMYDTNPDEVLIQIGNIISQVESLEFTSHPEVALNMVAGAYISNELTTEALVNADRILHRTKKQNCNAIVEQVHASWSKEFILK